MAHSGVLQLTQIKGTEMFNINTFKAHKQGIRENMESNLIWDKYHGTISHNSSREGEIKFIEIKFNDKVAEIADKMEQLSNLYKDGVAVEISEMIEQPYCTRHMVGTRYSHNVYTIRDEITERQVTRAMKKFMIKKIRNETGRQHVDLDCKVMDLFKDGLIDWNTVLQSHGKNCSI